MVVEESFLSFKKKETAATTRRNGTTQKKKRKKKKRRRRNNKIIMKKEDDDDGMLLHNRLVMYNKGRKAMRIGKGTVLQRKEEEGSIVCALKY